MSNTYNELKNRVALFAGALKNQGIVKGDRVPCVVPDREVRCHQVGTLHSRVAAAAREPWERYDHVVAYLDLGPDPHRNVDVLCNARNARKK